MGSQPTEKSSIKVLYPEHLRLVIYEEDDDDEFDADAEDESLDEDLMIIEDEDMEEDDDDDDEEEEKKEVQLFEIKMSKDLSWQYILGAYWGRILTSRCFSFSLQ